MIFAAYVALLPVDEAKRDSSLVAFRTQLLTAIRNRDRATLLKYVAPDIRTSFGETNGRQDLSQKLAKRTSPLWTELNQALTLGGAFQARTFWAPYVFAKWPEKYDAFEHYAVTKRAEPLLNRVNGRVIARLSYNIVKKTGESGRYARVTVPDGPKGFIQKSALRSPVGYRAALEKRNGKWQLTAFVAGD